jgi:hypothetical protein
VESLDASRSVVEEEDVVADVKFVVTENHPTGRGKLYQTFFSSSLTTKPNKLVGLFLETLSSQVFEFEGKARANPIGPPFRCFLLR